MFDEYYHTELAYYRMLAQEYAQEHAEVAYLVSERRGDQAVERLMQGASLLTARMRSRLDDDFPEIIHTLFDAMWPQYLRPHPAVAMLQFIPRPNVLRQSQTIKRNTEVESRKVDGVVCPFKTTAPLDLHPLDLVECGLHRPHPADLQLTLRFQMTGGVFFDSLSLSSLRLHLTGERPVRLSLYLLLTHYLKGISVEDSKGEICLRMPRKAVRPVGLGPDENICDYRPPLIPGVRLIQEYFVFQEKFLGFEIRGLQAIPKNRIENMFKLIFHLGSPPEANLKVTLDDFALGCTPAVNLSPSEQIDVAVEPGVTEYLLTAPNKGVIYTVDRVGAYDSRSGQWVGYPPLFARRGKGDDENLPRYQILRRSEGIEGVEIYLAIRDSEGRPLVPPAEMLHVNLTYTNGNRPMRLGLGEIDTPTSTSPEFCLFSNRSLVSPSSPLLVAKDRHWELLALFTMHPRDLMSVEGLQQILQTCHELRSTDQLIPTIQRVATTPSTRLHHQTVVPVVHVWVDLESRSFSGPGEVFLFARVLAHLFIDRPASTVLTQVTVTSKPDGTTYFFRDLDD